MDVILICYVWFVMVVGFCYGCIDLDLVLLMDFVFLVIVEKFSVYILYCLLVSLL